MSINKSNDENIATHTEPYYEELASQEQYYLDETEEELRAILTSDDPSPSRNGSSVWTDTRIIQTNDGPENAMFCASSTNRSSAHQGRTQY
jgi:hypothetical protein